MHASSVCYVFVYLEKSWSMNIFFSFLCIVYNIHSVVVASVCCVNKLRSFGSMRSLIGSFVWIRTTCHLPIKNKPKVIKCIKFSLYKTSDLAFIDSWSCHTQICHIISIIHWLINTTSIIRVIRWLKRVSLLHHCPYSVVLEESQWQ